MSPVDAGVTEVRVPATVLYAVAALTVVGGALVAVHVEGYSTGRTNVAINEGCFCHGAGSDPTAPADAENQDGQPEDFVEVTVDTSAIPDDGYRPDTVYEVVISVECTSSDCVESPTPENRGGFNMQVTDGTFPSDGESHYQNEGTVNDGGSAHATHTGSGNDQRSWTVQWRSPGRENGSVRLYAVANWVNGDGSYGPADHWAWVGFDDNGNGEADPAEKYLRIPDHKVPPDAPAGLTATPSRDAVRLDWQTADGNGLPIQGYRVYRARSSGSLSEVATTDGETTYNDTAVQDGVTYRWAVTAVTADGEGNMTDAVEANTTATVPGVPRLPAAQPGDGVVRLTWKAPADDGGAEISSYRVYRNATGGGLVPLDAIGGLRYEDRNVSNGATYTYAVAAVNVIGEGPRTADVTATPRAGVDLPPSVTIDEPVEGATLEAPVQVRGTASDPEGSLDRVEVRVDGGDWQAATGTAGWQATLHLAAGPHTIQARAHDPSQVSVLATVNVTVGDDSGPSDGGNRTGEENATGDAKAALATPSNLTVERVDGGHRLTWDPVPDGTAYRVERSLGGAFVEIAVVDGTSYEDRSVVEGVVHRYRVAATNGGVSPPSEAATVETSGMGPAGTMDTAILVAAAVGAIVVTAVAVRYG